MECLSTILRHRLHLTKKMHPDAVFYFVAATQTLTTSLSDRRLREAIATVCPNDNVETVAKEFNAIKEILEFEARDEHVEHLHTYINVIPHYDDPARIKLLKDML
jgi:REP element-mobilizing transposase RayT